MADKYPLDFDALEKGTWLEQEKLEEALGISVADGAKWNFELMGLKAQIEREAGIVPRIDHNRIRLMTDTEADEYLYRHGEMAVGKLVRVTKSRALIDRSTMSQAERQTAESRDRVMMGVATVARMELRKQRRAWGLTAGAKTLEIEGELED